MTKGCCHFLLMRQRWQGHFFFFCSASANSDIHFLAQFSLCLAPVEYCWLTIPVTECKCFSSCCEAIKAERWCLLNKWNHKLLVTAQVTMYWTFSHPFGHSSSHIYKQGNQRFANVFVHKVPVSEPWRRVWPIGPFLGSFVSIRHHWNESKKICGDRERSETGPLQTLHSVAFVALFLKQSSKHSF